VAEKRRVRATVDDFHESQCNKTFESPEFS
jgi:hypothetical protein